MRRKNNVIFSLLALVAAVAFFFFRFYHIENRVIFDFDQETFSRSVYDIVVNHHFTLIGPHVLSDKGFFLGPYFIYALVPFYLISHLHPVGLIYFMVAYNLIFFAAAAAIISRHWSKPHAIFFMLAWATNALIVRYDTTPWNPISIPLGVVLTWYILRKIYQENLFLHWILLGLTLGLFFNQHFQFGYIILFSYILLGSFQYAKRRIYYTKMLASIGAFFVTYIPLFLFDARHGFLNLKLFFSFFTEDIGGNIEHGRFLWIETYSTIVQPLIGYKDPLLTITFFVLFVLALLYLRSKKNGFFRLFYTSTLAMWIILPILFALYNRRLTDYYLISLYPFIYIVLIDCLLTGRRYILLTLGTLVAMYVNFSLLKVVVKPNPLGLTEKDNAINVMLQTVKKDTPYNISFNMPPGIATGYNYLLERHGIVRITIPGTPLIEFNIPKKDGDIDANMVIGIKIPLEVRK